MSAADPLTLRSLSGAAGLAAIPGLGEVWNHVLDTTERVHLDQDQGKLEPKGVVEVTLKITLSRPSPGSGNLNISHACSMKLPGYVKQGAQAIRTGSDWSFIDAEQPELPGVREFRPKAAH